MLKDKPNDPVAYIYDYLSQKKAGVAKPIGISNIKVANIKNLRKKVEHLQSQLGVEMHVSSCSSSDSEVEEE